MMREKPKSAESLALRSIKNASHFGRKYHDVRNSIAGRRMKMTPEGKMKFWAQIVRTSITLQSIKSFHHEIYLSSGTKLDTLEKILARSYASGRQKSLNNSMVLELMEVNQLHG
ncbi:MAG TPA: hypothetical protein HA254_04830 [Candidatus Diapherotrites archaeon]|uniref:Uncharacterized protein n=1 Tax=Candidatus Iainarchaeum sp. TaxID=3101447 RepID=A0A7J4IWR1_9ARCH|nr:hypothetical protein [Candidatus Diapherotrites archaeon]